jgi:hypothetical protein
MEFLPPIFSLFALSLMLNLLIFLESVFLRSSFFLFSMERRKALSSLVTTTMKSNVHDEFLKNVAGIF